MADRNLRIRMVLEAADRLSKPLRDIAQGGGRAGQAFARMRDRLKEIDRAQADIAAFRSLKTGLRTTSEAMEAARAKATALGRQLGQAAAPTRALRSEFARAKQEADQLAQRHEKETRALGAMRDRLAAAGVATRDLARHERDLRHEADRTADALERQTRRMEQMAARRGRLQAGREGFDRINGRATALAAGGSAAIATGIAAEAPVIASVKSAMEYESVMTDIAQKGELTRGQARAMGLEMLKAAKAANQMPEAMQQGVDVLLGFGANLPDARTMITPIGRAATAYKAEMADMAAATYAVHDNLKVAAGETSRVIDVMAQAGKSGAFEMKDMAQYFPQLTAGYQGLGQTGVSAVADLSAALQIARKGAGDSASAAGNLSNVLQKIASPATIKAFSKFGIDLPASLKRAYKEGKTPIEAIAELTKKALGGDLGKIGFLFEDAQVQQGLRPLIQNMEEYRRIRAQAMGAKGVTDTDFAERLNDTGERMKRLTIQTKAAGVVIGGNLLPIVAAGAERIGAFAERLSAWADRNPRMTKALAVMAASLGVLFMVMGGGAIAIAGLVAPFAALSFAAGFLGIGLMPIAGIALGIVAAIALLAGGAYLLYANWGAIGGFFAALWDKVRGIFTGAVSGVTGVLGGLWSGIKALFAVSLTDVYKSIAFYMGYALGAIVRFGGAAFAWLTGTLPGLLVSGFRSAWGMLTGAIGAAGSWLTTRLPQILAGAWSGAWAAFRAAVGFAFGTLPAMFAGFGRAIITGLLNGIRSAPGAIWNAAKGLAHSAAGGFRAGAGIHSPSRVFHQLGRYVTQGLDNGLGAGADGPLRRMDRLARGLADRMRLPAAGAALPADRPPALPVAAKRSLPPALPTRSLPPSLARLTVDASGMDGPLRRMDRLARGLAATMRLPVGNAPVLPERITAPQKRLGPLSARVGAALALGATAPAIASPAAPAGSQRAALPQPVGGDTYNITVQAAPGMDERRLVELLERKLRELAANKAASRGSAFADRQDWD